MVRIAGLGLLGAILGGVRSYYLCWHNSRDKSALKLNPDAERDARVRFMLSSDTAVDEAFIHSDKRGRKPGD